MEYEAERAELRELLDAAECAAARRTVFNAHCTGPAIAAEVWGALEDLGFQGGRVLEPGSGTGTFIGPAPEGVQVTGVELDPVTAAISQAIYPEATIRTEPFADTRMPGGAFDAAVGNVPFSRNSWHDPRHNVAGHSMHDHVNLPSLAPPVREGCSPARSPWMRRTPRPAGRWQQRLTCWARCACPGARGVGERARHADHVR